MQTISAGLSPVMAGCVILITADRRAEELGAAFIRRGASVLQAPVLSLIPNADDPMLLAATEAIIAAPPDVVIATTGVGFRGWIEAADAAGMVDDLLAVLACARIIARGPKARGAVQAAGLQTEWVAASEKSSEVLEGLLSEGVSGLRVAVQHHGAGSGGLDEGLTAAGAHVTGVVTYRWGPAPDAAAVEHSVRATAASEIDAVCFTSAPGVSAWLDAAERAGVTEALLERLRSGTTVAAAVGPITAEPLREVGIEPLVPERGRLGALVRVLVGHYQTAQASAIPTSAGPLIIRRNGAVLADRILPLTPSGLDVLRVLAQAQGSVVTRADLLAVLPGSSCDEHAAEVAIARLREAAGAPGLVRTVVKRGYRLDVCPA